MLNWIRKMLIQLLEWIIGESLPEVKARVIERKQQQAEKKAAEAARHVKRYKRIFTYSNGESVTVEGNCDEISRYTDAWGEAQTPANVRLIAVKEETTL